MISFLKLTGGVTSSRMATVNFQHEILISQVQLFLSMKLRNHASQKIRGSFKVFYVLMKFCMFCEQNFIIYCLCRFQLAWACEATGKYENKKINLKYMVFFFINIFKNNFNQENGILKFQNKDTFHCL